MGIDDDAVPADRARARRLAEEVAADLVDVVYALQVVPDLRFRYVSESVARLSGYTPDELYANPAIAVDSTDPDHQEALETAFALPPGSHFDFTVPWARKTGDVVWTHHRCQVVRHDDGSVVVYAAGLDLSEHKRTEEALASSEAHYRLLAENASDMVWRTDLDAVVQWVSPSVVSVMGWQPHQMVGRRILDQVHPDDLSRVREATATANDGGRVAFEARYLNGDGTYRWLQVTARPILDASGAVIGKAGSCRDVDAEVEARQRAERSQRLFRLAMESAPSGMAVVDLDRRLVEVNQALADMLGHDPDWLLACRIPDLLHPEDDAVDLAMRAEVLSGRSSSVIREVRLRTSDGRVIWAQHGVGLLRDDDGTPLSYVSQLVDVTEARRSRDELEHLASHDGLTGLANRRQLLEWMDPILSHHGRAGTRLAVLYLDLDGLKPVNDRYGHHAGDELIVEVAHRIATVVRDDDVAARLGGDEFIVALPAVADIDDALVVAAKLREAIREPVSIDGGTVEVSASIGVALAQAGENPARVLQHADLALYRAKQSGRDRVEVFESSMDARRG
jgi:diguanylate cyclase (GGDEF)-like protein/PAS domain S-box-containing protein